ncbi:MAG: hypothetical protein KA717_23755 [Woronichinia naegeliana WA131]|uniref:Uncharacterized protein n=1 Tax=Woronichinia naegeliana WA131 TaxID=2824559 RepID=A0A977KV98_9CYAN|nr:MAG: hypothetical protein KA717_23755 [Woronichinia naegeliana WA131]
MSEKSMLPIPPEEKALLKQHLTESARILRKYTEPVISHSNKWGLILIKPQKY